MSDETPEGLTPGESTGGEARHVPVAEAIKYRRRAQQAESRIQDVEQQLEELRSQFEQDREELAAAEAQRDEARMQLTVTENRLAAERILGSSGVIDLETASMLLSKRVDFAEELDTETLTTKVEQLLLDKPFLRRASSTSLPPKTASVNPAAATTAGQLASAAERAAQSGDRKDIAEYLRLRREVGMT